jgi:hypothetical protein
VSNHSPFFAPEVRPALATGIAAEVEALRYFFGMKPEEIRRASEPGDAKR